LVVQVVQVYQIQYRVQPLLMVVAAVLVVILLLVQAVLVAVAQQVRLVR
jgi:hypothetical protein